MTLEKEKVSAEIQKVVLRLMDEGGIDNIRARSIAREVGVSVGTIYNFHGSLDGLIEEVCSGILKDFGYFCEIRMKQGTASLQKRMAGELEQEGREVGELMLRFLNLADIYIDYIETNERRWNAMLAFNRSRPVGAGSRKYQEEQENLLELIGEVVSDTRLGRNEEERDHAVRALWSGVHGIVLMNYLGQASEETREYTWHQIVLLVRYFVRGVVQ